MFKFRLLVTGEDAVPLAHEKDDAEVARKMKVSSLPLSLMVIVSVFTSASHTQAQNSSQLFSPLNVRASQSGAGYGESQVIFNTNTLNLTCPASPIAVLSSAASTSPQGSTGNLLVDNNINITNLTTSNGPVNVCKGGVNGSPQGPFENCFTSTYQNSASAGALTGQSPDSFVATGGVAPIDISSLLVSGAQQVKIDLVDEGGYVANSSLYLNTNCTPGGVTGPALISGNTIPPSNPTPQQLNQDFTFNTSNDQMIGFEYDLSGAQSAGSLTIDPNGVNPQVGDSALEPLAAYPLKVSGTSFATSICLVHNGELLDGQPACKLYTLTCTTGTGATATGAQCPSSTLSNEQIRDVFDGPAFDLNDIPTPGGPTFHEGMGFLMASEGWDHGSCTFDSASSLQDLSCPQNLLTSFTGPGLYIGTSQTTRPNSTFISIAKVPEDLTTVTVTNSSGQPVSLGPGNWTNNSNPYVKLSSLPPNLTGTALPGAANFVASPIRSITYGISPANNVPVPGASIPSDTVLENTSQCPDNPAATVFTPPVQSLTGLEDGNYLLHYFAQDCAGTQELKFAKDNSGSWITSFYTFPINVDTVQPDVASGPTLSPAGPYYQGQIVSATYRCTDDRSGIVGCGGKTYGSGVADTGTLTATVPTSSSGSQTFTVLAMDAAGNQKSQSVNYQVNAVDSQIHLSLSPDTVTYPLGTNLTVQLSNINGHVPTGTVKIVDKGTVLVTLNLSSGAAYYYLKNLSAGTHSLSAVYSGDRYNPAGTSAPVTLNVLPVPVVLALSCWNTPYPYGANFQCVVNASSNAGAPLGSITYIYDGNSPITVPLVSGAVNIVLPKPPVGNHSLSVSYPAQTNYAAAGPKVQNFSVTPAPVVVQLTPSAWYVTGGTLTLSASVQSSSAGPPNATGTVTFTNGATVLASVPVNATGKASTSVLVASLPKGNDVITATYAGGTNYGTGSSSITVQVAK